ARHLRAQHHQDQGRSDVGGVRPQHRGACRPIGEGMRAETIRAAGVPEPKANSYSNCKKVGNQVFISGLVAWDDSFRPLGGTDPYEQTRIVFSYMKKLMEAAGGEI